MTRNLLARLGGLDTQGPGVSPWLDVGFIGLGATVASLKLPCCAVESDLGGPGRPQLVRAIVGLVCRGSHREGNVQGQGRAWFTGPPGRVGHRPLHWAVHAHAQWRLCIISRLCWLCWGGSRAHAPLQLPVSHLCNEVRINSTFTCGAARGLQVHGV